MLHDWPNPIYSKSSDNALMMSSLIGLVDVKCKGQRLRAGHFSTPSTTWGVCFQCWREMRRPESRPHARQTTANTQPGDRLVLGRRFITFSFPGESLQHCVYMWGGFIDWFSISKNVSLKLLNVNIFCRDSKLGYFKLWKHFCFGILKTQIDIFLPPHLLFFLKYFFTFLQTKEMIILS